MVKFADRMDLLKSSEIRELLKLANQPDIISFAGGMPAPELFPVEKVKAAADAVLDEAGRIALQYTSTDGWPRLREQISERMLAKNNIKTDPANILVTSGSQQGLDYSARVFINPGDVIVLESPSYLGAVNAFKACQPTFVEIPTDNDGMIMEELEKVLATTENVKMIYVIPDFQNPTGRTWPLDRRLKFMEIINKYEIPVVEDNPYGELRFRGEGGYSFGRYLGEQCCMLGTFSKVVSPGMRVGWLACKNKLLREKLTAYKMTMDLHTNIFCQMVLAQYLADNDLDQHIEKTKELYQHKADFMMECISKYLPEGVTYTKPEGGMFIWATVPEGMKAVEVQSAAIKKGVVVVAGDPFYEYERGVRTMRINYSNSTDDAIEKGIRLLGDTIRELQASK
ncbi:MAG: PLP-dependent aminotransferase family protein [Clostridia bacterium]|nr:PLP-dependent aminotransferase family protein [Clostridia bacterium]